jgi:hypothetical protein
MTRYWWLENENSNIGNHFKWSPCSIKTDFPRLGIGKMK